MTVQPAFSPPDPPPAPDMGVSIRPDTASITLHRRDPARRMARYYTLSVEVTLFSDWSCTRSFGRIGARGGRIMVGLYATRAEAAEALRHWLRAKQGRGYRPVGPVR